MLKIILIAMLPFMGIFSNGSDPTATGPNQYRDGSNGTMEKMIVASGSVAMDLDLSRLNGSASRAKTSRQGELRFDVEHDSFFTILVFNDELRGALPSSMKLIQQNSATLPAKLTAAAGQLMVEATPFGEQYELAVRDSKSGFIFFNVEGVEYDYAAAGHTLSVNGGRLLLSKEFAAEIGRPAEAGTVIGKISLNTNMRSIEISHVVNDEVVSDVMPAAGRTESGSVPGPDVIVGDLNGLSQPDSGIVNGQVGISVGTDSCNLGVVDLDWFQLPSNDHPVIPQNLYRMSGGATNSDRFEQIGQSSVKHAFTALTENICSLGCNGTGGTHLGSGCSDPYVVSLNSGGASHNLGSRAWINPYTGLYPRGDSATSPNIHTGHTHNAVSHRMVVNVSDLNTTLNPGATYYAEAQYITPHEYVWCQAHAGQCNMNNNVSYRQYTVSGTAGPFSFGTGAFVTQRTKSAIVAWTGATINKVEPDPNNDGIAWVGYKVTNPSPGVWHYEYAIYNQNLDRAIQSFSVPLGAGITVSNADFHAPPQQPAWAADGTAGSAGFSSAPWTPSQSADSISWGSENFAQNANANAVRWGTLYNVRFDSNRPPQATTATVGFFKTGSPVQVAIQGPTPAAPTNVTVGGRVFTNFGNPASGVQMILSDGVTNRVTLSSSLGYYSFDNVLTGITYTITPSTKRYSFNPQTVQPTDNVANLDFTANP